MYKQKELKSGLKLVTVPMTGTKTVTVLVIIKTGSKNENKKNNGISHFIEHMLFKGTDKRPNTLIIASELDRIGAEFNAFTGKECTGFWVKADSAKVGIALDMLNDILLHSKIDSKEIDRERGTIIEEMNMYEDNPMMQIDHIFEQCLYGNTPAGWDTIGTKKNILEIKRADMLNYLKTQYSADKIVVCLAGNINKKVEDLVSKYFKFKKLNFIDKVLTKEKQAAPKINLSYKKTDQATISLGVRTIPREDKDEVVLKFLGILLGGSMSSRLFTEVRERQGLAYYIRANAEFYDDTGYLTAQAGVPINKIEQAIITILKEYKKLSKTLVSEEELKRNKDLIRGRSILQLEASDNVANWYSKQALFRKSITSPEEYFKKIDKVTAKDIQRVAKEIFNNKGLNLAIIGPFKDKKKFAKILKF